MESYQVLARKYRPSNFSELVGQEQLVKVMSGAIEQNRIPHAIMLTGIRGVGKTTSARIIAKSLNCEKGASLSPCNICHNCEEIAKSMHPDIIEFDAASKTGVADIRNIINSANYGSMKARYKIYIIDEVHMLSKQAFNALLKTLEEPPENVLFILATTEIRKVPVTILSRCQKFFLRTLSFEEIISHLKNILQKEGWEIDNDSLYKIAVISEGSVRDSLSLLDQAISNSDHASKKIPVEVVENMLSWVDKETSAKFFLASLQGKVKEADEIVEGLFSGAANFRNLAEDILEIINFCVKIKISSVATLLKSMSKPYQEIVEKISKDFQLELLLRIWQIVVKSVEEEHIVSHKMSASMLAVKIAYTSLLPSPTELSARIESNLLNNVINSIE